MKERFDITNTLLEMVRNGRCEERYMDSVYDAIDYINANHEEARDETKTYVCLDEIRQFPIRLKTSDKEYGKRNFVYGIETVMEYIETLPRYKIGDQPFTKFTYTGMTGWDWDDKED